MTDDLKKLLDRCDEYKSASTECLKTMRAARTYASLNEPIFTLEEYILMLREKCDDLYLEITNEAANIGLDTDDILKISTGLAHLGNAILKLEKADKIFVYVNKALNGEEEIKSAKKDTKVNMVGKTVKKIKSDNFNGTTIDTGFESGVYHNAGSNTP